MSEYQTLFGGGAEVSRAHMPAWADAALAGLVPLADVMSVPHDQRSYVFERHAIACASEFIGWHLAAGDPLSVALPALSRASRVPRCLGKSHAEWCEVLDGGEFDRYGW